MNCTSLCLPCSSVNEFPLKKYYIGIGWAKKNMVVIGRYCEKMVKLGTNQKDGAVIALHQKGRVELLGENAKNKALKKFQFFLGHQKVRLIFSRTNF